MKTMTKRYKTIVLKAVVLFICVGYVVYFFHVRKDDVQTSTHNYKHAEDLISMGYLDSAIFVYKELYNGDSVNSYILNELGLLYKKNGDLKQSVYFLDKAIILDPENHSFYNNRGNVRMGLNKMQDAEDDFSKSILIDNSYAPAYNSRGYLKYLQKRYDEAILDYSSAIKFDSKYDIAYSNRAIVYFQIQDYCNALNDFNKALRLNPRLSKAYINRGITKYQLMDKKGACRDWEKAIRFGEKEAEKLYDEYCKGD